MCLNLIIQKKPWKHLYTNVECFKNVSRGGSWEQCLWTSHSSRLLCFRALDSQALSRNVQRSTESVSKSEGKMCVGAICHSTETSLCWKASWALSLIFLYTSQGQKWECQVEVLPPLGTSWDGYSIDIRIVSRLKNQLERELNALKKLQI